MNDNYKYQFKYINGDTTYCTEFEALHDIGYIVNQFKRFLISSGWYSEQVNKIQLLDEGI